MPLLKAQDIVFRVENIAILDHLSLTLASGKIHALIGPNGSGKSTFAAMVMGCEGFTPSFGSLVLDNRDITHLEIHQRARLGIAMAWQEPVRFEGLGVAEYLRLGHSRIDPAATLAMVGLNPNLYIHRQVDKSLSGGERKRIELASILGLKPRLAILDEPDSGIDMLSTGDIIKVVKRFQEYGAAVLLITHREEIALMADCASLMCNGRVLRTGKPAQVTAWYREKKILANTGEDYGSV